MPRKYIDDDDDDDLPRSRRAKKRLVEDDDDRPRSRRKDFDAEPAKSKKILIIGIASGVGVLALAIVLFLIFRGKSSNNSDGPSGADLASKPVLNVGTDGLANECQGPFVSANGKFGAVFVAEKAQRNIGDLHVYAVDGGAKKGAIRCTMRQFSTDFQITISSDGKYVLLAENIPGSGTSLQIWSVADSRQQVQNWVPYGREEIYLAEFVANNQLLIVLKNGRFRLWQMSEVNNQLVIQENVIADQAIPLSGVRGRFGGFGRQTGWLPKYSVAIDPKLEKVAIYHGQKSVGTVIYTLVKSGENEPGMPIASVAHFENQEVTDGRALAFSPNGKNLLIGLNNPGKFIALDWQAGTIIAREDPTVVRMQNVSHLAWWGDDNIIGFGSRQNAVIYNIPIQNIARQVMVPGSGVNQTEFVVNFSLTGRMFYLYSDGRNTTCSLLAVDQPTTGFTSGETFMITPTGNQKVFKRLWMESDGIRYDPTRINAPVDRNFLLFQ
ncbi:MAG: hypothetical protein R3B84_21285 [Zavarzinella sp.]